MNTKPTNKSFRSQITTVFMVMMLVLAALPIQPARADTAGFLAPGIYSNSNLLNPGNAYASDDQYVQSNGNNKSAVYGNFGFSLPNGSTINLVELSVEGHGNKNWKVAVSNNNGVSYSAFATIINTGPDTTTLTGGPGTLWGLTGWTAASLGNANFKVKLVSAGGSSANIAYLDQLKVRVTYSSAASTPTTLVITPPSAGTYGGTVNLQATLTSNGVPVSGKAISFALDGFSKGSPVLTNASGVATLSGVTLTTGLSNTVLNVGNYVVGATFSGDSTYAFSSDADTQVVNALPITVTANAQGKIYGASDPALTYLFAPSLIGTDTFSGSLTRVAGENVGTHAITQGTLALSPNYAITYVGANLTISPLAITVTADNKAIHAGNPDPPFTYGVSRFVGTDAFITPPSCGVQVTHVAAGTYPIVCSGGNAGANYSLTYVDGVLTVSDKIILTVTAEPKIIAYGSSDPIFTFVYNGFVDNDTDITGTAPQCSVSGSHTNAGVYPSITCSGGVDTKYEFSYISGTLTVNQLPVTVTANAQSKTYGSTDPTLIYGFAPALISGDGFTGLLARNVGENVGSYAITQGSLALGANYAITYAGANLTINKAPLTVTADDQTIAFRASDPLFTFQYDGLVNGETSAVINTPPSCGVSGTHTALGTYPIICSGGSDDNYSFTYVNGIFTVMDPTGSDTVGVFRPSNGALYLKNYNTTGFADVAINYGLGGDYPVVGDWDGNDTDTIGVYRNGVFYLRNSNTLGFADLTVTFGTPGDQPIAGDWNGDGTDTIGVYRRSTGQFLLRNSNTSGAPEMSFYLGNVGDVGIAGDWNGDGMDTTGVFRPSNGVIFLKNTNVSGFADVALNYGLPGDQPVVGDWDNNGTTTIGIYRNARFYLRNSNTNGFADILLDLGNVGDMPIAGDWNGIP